MGAIFFVAVHRELIYAERDTRDARSRRALRIIVLLIVAALRDIHRSFISRAVPRRSQLTAVQFSPASINFTSFRALLH